MTLAHVGALIGGLGLFLLGMTMLTDGLKMTAGHSLKSILGHWTDTRFRALGAGFLITALVQSSGAVTVAVIGFVNAGLLTFSNAVWVVFGANVGTTMTAWIVSLVGLQLKVGALALPAVGLGVALRLTGGGRRAAIGDVLAGFGLFFLGLSILSDTFSGYANGMDLTDTADPGFAGNLLFMGLGFGVTVLTQSSSASIAIALTAAAGGLVPLQPAAAMVIGANLGSTSTGLFAVIGATPSARRVAVSHLAFNVLTGTVALLMLPGFLSLLSLFGRAMTLPDNPAVFLSLFHTTFNIVGVLLMWPLSGSLIRWLSRRFVTDEEDDIRLRYLDRTTAQVPALAGSGVVRELDRLSDISGALLEKTVSAGASDAAYMLRRADVVQTLSGAIGRYLSGLYQGALPRHMAGALVHSARALQHFDEAAEITRYLVREADAFKGLPETLRAEAKHYVRIIGDAARITSHGGVDAKVNVHNEARKVKDAYRALKDRLLGASAATEIDVATLDVATRTIWHMRRAAVQLLKARRRIEEMRHAIETASAVDAGEPEPESDAGDDLADRKVL